MPISALDFIEKLKPVSYRFKRRDHALWLYRPGPRALPTSLRDTVERSDPEHEPALIERQNDEDRTYRVSYGELFAPIVNSIQQQQREITQVRQQKADLRRALEDQAAAFKAENDALRRAIEALREQLTAAR
jgi:small-conductance mechanosensitive channel